MPFLSLLLAVAGSGFVQETAAPADVKPHRYGIAIETNRDPEPRLDASTVRDVLDRPTLARRAKELGFEIQTTKDDGAILVPALDRTRARAAHIKRLLDYFAKQEAFAQGAPCPVTLGSIPAESREAVRASMSLATNRDLPPSYTVYAGMSGDLVLNDGTRTVRYPIDGGRDRTSAEWTKAEDDAPVTPEAAPFGSPKMFEIANSRLPAMQAVGDATIDLGGDLRVVRWGTALNPTATVSVMKNVALALERREAERQALLDAATKDALATLAARSPLYRATTDAIGKGVGDLPPSLGRQAESMARNWKSYGFGSEDEARTFLKNAKVDGVRLSPSLTVVTKGADGKAEWHAVEY